MRHVPRLLIFAVAVLVSAGLAGTVGDERLG